MTAQLVWVTGRAAAGKSTVITELVRQLRQHGQHPVVYHDEDLLLGLVHADADHRHHWHPHDDGQIAFTTGHLFDQSLRNLNQHLVHELDIPNALAVVELARGRHAPPVDVSYRRALHLLDQRLWAHSQVFRLHADVDTQLRRNADRHTGTGIGTPDAVMRQLYTDDDPHTWTGAGIPITHLPAQDLPSVNAARILAAVDRAPPGHNI